MTSISFEVFPPQTATGRTILAETVVELATADPSYVSITYGAGGSNRNRTFAAIETLRRATPTLPVAGHLTCVGQTIAEVEAVIDRYQMLGVERIVALRGDPPTGIEGSYTPDPSGFQRTSDLVAAIAQRGVFGVTVSAYPEVHPQSVSMQHDIEVLAAKVAAGADAAMTQMFFDNERYLTYLDQVRAAGIDVPIIPGIFPIHDLDKVSEFARQCGATMPSLITERFADAAQGSDDAQASFDTAVAIAADQIADLAAHGVNEFHLYTLNRSALALAVCDEVASRLPTQPVGSLS